MCAHNYSSVMITSSTQCISYRSDNWPMQALNQMSIPIYFLSSMENKCFETLLLDGAVQSISNNNFSHNVVVCVYYYVSRVLNFQVYKYQPNQMRSNTNSSWCCNHYVKLTKRKSKSKRRKKKKNHRRNNFDAHGVIFISQEVN